MIPRRSVPLVREDASEFLSRAQRAILLMVIWVVAISIVSASLGILPARWFGLKAVLILLIALMTVSYVGVIWYKSMLVLRGAREPARRGSLRTLEEVSAARYTILVPLYKEAAVLSQLIMNLQSINYPHDKLQVLVLVEDDDLETITALGAIALPNYFEIVLVPESFPRTKPKACNVGLEHANGEFCVIYDAEDRPDPDQLWQALDAFARAPRKVVCVQAELQYFNPSTNVLTRWFAAEYALNFSLMLPGLTRSGAPVPLGGTSNHFRTAILRELGGWDGFNVTEDADLGIWIARAGLQVEMIDSVTWEEANSKPGNWIRQRSRWIKGYLQTYLVHMRHPITLGRQLGVRNFWSFQCMVGGTPLTLLVNPVFWLLTVAYVGFGQHWVSAVFPTPVLYLGVFSMIVGNLLTLWFQMAACMKRGLYPSVKWLLAVPAYWVLMSMAAFKALGQLLNPRLRHHWEKTTHGLVADEHAIMSVPLYGAGQETPTAQIAPMISVPAQRGPSGGEYLLPVAQTRTTVHVLLPAQGERRSTRPLDAEAVGEGAV
ncbi:glycosyltransferase [Nakamurella sp. PAMC28650]|nr:glycosyltransferase [Nakamurella sp. PAMC28650]